MGKMDCETVAKILNALGNERHVFAYWEFGSFPQNRFVQCELTPMQIRIKVTNRAGTELYSKTETLAGPTPFKAGAEYNDPLLLAITDGGCQVIPADANFIVSSFSFDLA